MPPESESLEWFCRFCRVSVLVFVTLIKLINVTIKLIKLLWRVTLMVWKKTFVTLM